MEVLHLDNGLKVIVNSINDLDILACTLFLPVGSSVEPKEKSGTTFLSLKTAFKRSLKRSVLEFSKLQEQWGTSFIPDVSNDYSTLQFQIVPDGLEEYLELLQEVLEEPGFTEESFSVEKETLLASIRSRVENPFSFAYEHLTDLTYKGTPYEKLPSGTELTVNSLTLKDVKNWFKRTLLPQGTIFSFCGNVKQKDRIADMLSKLKTRNIQQEVSFKREIKTVDELELKRKKSSQTFIMLCFNAPDISQENYLDYKLFNTLLGEGIGSVLFQELREKMGFAYSTGSFFPSRKNSGRLFIYIGTSPEKEKEVKEKVLELKNNLPDFITTERVRRAKQFFRGSFELDHETRMKRAWYSGFWEMLGKGATFDREILNIVESVTIPQLKEVAETVALESYHVVVVKDG